MAKITVKDTEVTVIKVQNEDYIYITDMAKAKGLCVKNGRYGGTFAHKDIAFEFGYPEVV